MSMVKGYHHRAPVESLPNELLAVIFKTVQHLTESPIGFVPFPFPFIVSSVNRHWRAVALGYPGLWTSFDFSFMAPIEYTKLWFERSQPCPVDATFNFMWSARDSFYQLQRDSIKAAAFRATIEDHAQRLSRLTILATIKSDVDAIIDAMGHSVFSRLQYFHLYVCPYIRWDFSSISQKKFGLLAPSLRSLELREVDLQYLPVFANLIYLDIKHSTLPAVWQFRIFMSGLPCLTHLVLSGAPTGNLRPSETTLIQVPSLRFLAFNSAGHHGRICSCIISYLSTPNLEYLEMKYSYLLSSEFSKHLKIGSSIQSRFPKLRTLRLARCTVPAEDTDALSMSFPMVTDLVFDQVEGVCLLLCNLYNNSGRLPAVVPELLVDSSKDNFLWPRLNVITFLHPRGWSSNLFCHALSDRIEAGIPLRKVRLCHGLEGDRELFKDKIDIEMIGPSTEPGLLEEKDVLFGDVGGFGNTKRFIRAREDYSYADLDELDSDDGF